jgi:glutamate-1-semialdehyde 2,1-aminomutase/spore coat polysaccharide biosynthesis protein SpsF
VTVSRSHTISETWWARAQRVIPGGTQTLSKARDQWIDSGLPLFLLRGVGGHVWDVDGHEWIDFPMALGPVLLGHAEPLVEEAIVRQLRDGISYTLAHPLEVEVAERIVELCPGVEAVRFAKTGSDATTAAVRVARAYTGRNRVVVCGYHGWHDWYAASTPRAKGVPAGAAALVDTFPFNDLTRLADLLAGGDVAAVVLEPSGAALPEPGFLTGVVDLCRRFGTVSVFDEAITGFRIAPGGVREKYGVRPDLSCYGKALGNGMPIAVIAGSWEVMRQFEAVLFSGTYGGETLSLAAARAVLDVVAHTDVLAEIEATGRALQSGMRASVERHNVADRVSVGGEPSRPVVTFGPDGVLTRSWLQRCLAGRGVLFNGAFNVCARHSPDDVRVALDAFDGACAGIAERHDLAGGLRGRQTAPPLRRL